MTKADTSLVEAARQMLANGLHVFPLDHPEKPRCLGKHGPTNPCDGSRGKHPAVKWGTWAAAPTPQMLDMEWRRHGGIANIGIACGPSNVVVLDEDAPGELDKWAVTYGVDLPDTYTVTTGRGRHLYYAWDHSQRPITNTAKAMDGFKIDVRGKGGFAVAEHSQHASGAVYTGNGLPVTPLPDKVADLLVGARPATTQAPDWEPVWEPITSNPNDTKIAFHERHKALIKYAGRLHGLGLDYEEAVPVYRERWLLCEQPTGQVPEAKFHGTPPPECAYPVTWGEAEDKLRDVFTRYPAGAAPSDDEQPEPTTWEPVDLGPYLSGKHHRPQPTLGFSRSDGQKMLYAGAEHVVIGETESGKSWFALGCVAVELRMGRNVLYIHYEEGDPDSTIERLLLLGVPAADIAAHLTFVAPSKASRAGWLGELLDCRPVLVVHDGVNEAMSLHGADIMAADGAATFRRNLITPCLRAGAATLACDHVPKSVEGRGRDAYGSVHKGNALDGARIVLENIEPFGRGLRGASHVFVTKDRPGHLRAEGKPTKVPGKTFFGTLVVDDGPTSGPDFMMFYAPKDDDDSDGDPKKKGTTTSAELREITFDVLAALPDQKVTSLRMLYAAMRTAGQCYREDVIRGMVDDLVVTGRVREIPGKRNAQGYQIVPNPSAHADPKEVLPATAAGTAAPIERGSGQQSTHDCGGSSGQQSAAVKESASGETSGVH